MAAMQSLPLSSSLAGWMQRRNALAALMVCNGIVSAATCIRDHSGKLLYVLGAYSINITECSGAWEVNQLASIGLVVLKKFWLEGFSSIIIADILETTKNVLFPVSGISSLSSAVCHSSSSSFYGKSIHISSLKRTQIALKSPASRPVIMMIKPVIQFIQGTDEQTVPDVSLTRSRDGTNGVATFTFEEPSVFDSSSELGDITGLYMIDEEGVLQSTNVSAKFVNGKPSTIEAKYTMRSPREWDRFMRFMERYSNAKGLQFVKK
ncbi:Photosystem II reaction center PSB28 protein, chloroplastic [Apostasia shenzhenica]|uniref:Photosystem II reaction center Psb28 protein n=1 Tax=Apostasia shenzhenica TaxID=1088818 RepID=A0A2I0BFB4_9ASPA|nr:Photosystem II reaction center PSB28 protein, chloroplastic [Apostasia shenzhenica]